MFLSAFFISHLMGFDPIKAGTNVFGVPYKGRVERLMSIVKTRELINLS